MYAPSGSRRTRGRSVGPLRDPQDQARRLSERECRRARERPGGRLSARRPVHEHDPHGSPRAHAGGQGHGRDQLARLREGRRVDPGARRARDQGRRQDRRRAGVGHQGCRAERRREHLRSQRPIDQGRVCGRRGRRRGRAVVHADAQDAHASELLQRHLRVSIRRAARRGELHRRRSGRAAADHADLSLGSRQQGRRDADHRRRSRALRVDHARRAARSSPRSRWTR